MKTIISNNTKEDVMSAIDYNKKYLDYVGID